MRMRLIRRTAVAALGCLTMLGLTVAPAGAQSTQLTVQNYAFSPTPVIVAQGTSVTWHNLGPSTHTSTGDSPLSLWATGNVVNGATSAAVVFRAAGGFTYHCSIHLQMTAAVRVPILVAPATGTTMTTFTLTLASATQTGFTYDVQRKIGTGAWATYKTGLKNRTTTFKATAPGTYYFRSRLVRTSNHGFSKWSPMKHVVVS
jgi:plastocyanin